MLKAICGSDKTPLIINKIILPCYVLKDGTRVFSGRGIQRALGAKSSSSGTWLSKFVNSSPLTPLLSKALLIKFNKPIIFQRNNASGSQEKTNGYEATILIDICDAVIEANDRHVFNDTNIIANAKAIIRAVAKVGIIALVDEATGYQYEREHLELQKILEAYVSKEILKWQLTFTDDFYKELFRLWKVPYTTKYLKRRPQFFGRITKKYVYDLLPSGVVDRIKKNTGKTAAGNWKYKWHQSLTPEVGRECLKKHITEVTTLMSVSKDKDKFETLFKRKFGNRAIDSEKQL